MQHRRRLTVLVALPAFLLVAYNLLQLYRHEFSSNWSASHIPKLRDMKKRLARSRRHFAAEMEMFADLEVMQEMKNMRPLSSFALTPWKTKNNRLGPRKSKTQQRGINLAMVILVKSHANNTRQRTIARQTWASYEYIDSMQLETVFIVGLPHSHDATVQLQIENQTYGDLLQIDITESYENIVYKTLAGMQWASDNFPSNWFYTSTDDDIMPDLLRIQREIRKIIQTELTLMSTSKNNPAIANTIDLLASKKNLKDVSQKQDLPIFCGFGYRVKTRPKRDESSKWFMDEEKYPERRYPPYCFGGWYTMTVGVAAELYTLSRLLPLFWIDDLWLTGFVRLKYYSGRKSKCHYCNVSNTTMGLWTENPWDDVAVVTGNENVLLEKWDSLLTELSTYNSKTRM